MPAATAPRSASCKPLFAGFARATRDLGAFGNGSKMKYVANLLVAINNVASAEAMVLGLKAGLDPQTSSTWCNRAPATRGCSNCARR